MPQFVKDEFDAYLECGILAHGFMRLRCEGCARELLVAWKWGRVLPIAYSQAIGKTRPFAVTAVNLAG